MYNPNGRFEIDIFKRDETFTETSDSFYTEAVFVNGRETLEPLLQAMGAIKAELASRIKEVDDSVQAINDWQNIPKGEHRGPRPKAKVFDPRQFWKSNVWKVLEDRLCETFGLRHAQIMPYVEKYMSSEKMFESRELNAFVYHTDRYPVEALLTDKGLYDESHSLIIDVRISLGLIMALEADEILAVLLHEIGHGIDPALVDIKFLETNILSKYLTDRKGAINKDEQKIINEKKSKCGGIIILALIGLSFIPSIIEFFKRLFKGKKKYNKDKEQELIAKIKKELTKEKNQFNRQTYSEAFADNFARMYGYGAQMSSALRKMSDDYMNYLKSRITKEDKRREAITLMTIDLLNDVHKTDLHRIRNLIREYNADINDPNIPEPVKKQLREDKEELEKVLDQYLNNSDAFQARINKLVYEELEKLDNKVDAGKPKSKMIPDPVQVPVTSPDDTTADTMD